SDRQDCRDKISKALSYACASFDHQVVALAHSTADRLGHFELLRTRLVRAQTPRDQSAGAKHISYRHRPPLACKPHAAERLARGGKHQIPSIKLQANSNTEIHKSGTSRGQHCWPNLRSPGSSRRRERLDDWCFGIGVV